MNGIIPKIAIPVAVGALLAGGIVTQRDRIFKKIETMPEEARTVPAYEEYYENEPTEWTELITEIETETQTETQPETTVVETTPTVPQTKPTTAAPKPVKVNVTKAPTTQAPTTTAAPETSEETQAEPESTGFNWNLLNFGNRENETTVLSDAEVTVRETTTEAPELTTVVTEETTAEQKEKSTGIVQNVANKLSQETAEIVSTTALAPPTTTKKQLPASAYIKGVPFLNQNKMGYPMGCEAFSATMVLKYYGYKVTPAQMVDAIPKVSKKYKKDGKWYGGDPFEGFVGDPTKTGSEGAYGCFAKPVETGMKKFAGNRVKNISGCSIDELFMYVAEGHPVVVWGCSNGKNLTDDITWNIVDKKGKPTGKTFTMIKGEHCMVLIGYDKDNVILNNPSHNADYKQEKSLFIKNWNRLYKQAIIVE